MCKVHHLDFDALVRPANQIALSMASAILAGDYRSKDSAVLFHHPHLGGTVVEVELEDGQVLFEGPQLVELIAIVERLKGSCCFKLSATSLAPAKGFGTEPTNRIIDSLKHELLDDDDDDLKGGAE